MQFHIQIAYLSYHKAQQPFCPMHNRAFWITIKKRNDVAMVISFKQLIYVLFSFLTDIDDCGNSPCGANGNCTDGVDMYTCTCHLGYTGTNCESNIDECRSDPCQNSGNCTDEVNGFSCSCDAGYSGDICETGNSLLYIPPS